jgi:uncharacterized DUF497 family protein
VPTVVHGDYEWDDAKASSNADKHDVAFEEAVQALSDLFAVSFDDSIDPSNLVTLARSPSGRILYAVTTVRGDRIRVISARIATRPERRRYGQG